jgi:hypothetical protein
MTELIWDAVKLVWGLTLLGIGIFVLVSFVAAVAVTRRRSVTPKQPEAKPNVPASPSRRVK